MPPLQDIIHTKKAAPKSDVFKALTRTLSGSDTLPIDLDLNSDHQFIIFSDQHKGAGDEADEFRLCKTTYVTALEHYLREGFSLILLGDAEELWEQGFREVEKAYPDVLKLEGRFPKGRYYRIWGNHDDEWMTESSVQKTLAKHMPPESVVHEAIRFDVVDQNAPLGTILLLHGHQGTFGSDKIRRLSRIAVRFYRCLQRWFGIGKTTPAKDACLRGKHDTEMHDWAKEQVKLILVAGHTHRPVWSSKTHLQKLQDELIELQAGPDTPQQQALIAAKVKEIAEREAKSPPCNDQRQTSPVYFNGGCCRYDDGDITGIELEGGQIRLIKWSRKTLARSVLEQDALAKAFQNI